jgi:hypothetical protein
MTRATDLALLQRHASSGDISKYAKNRRYILSYGTGPPWALHITDDDPTADIIF